MGRSQVLYNRTKGRFRNRNEGRGGRGGRGNGTAATEEKNDRTARQQQQQQQQQQPQKYKSLAERSQQEFRGKSKKRTGAVNSNAGAAGFGHDNEDNQHERRHTAGYNKNNYNKNNANTSGKISSSSKNNNNHYNTQVKSPTKYMDETAVMMLADNPPPSTSSSSSIYYDNFNDYRYSGDHEIGNGDYYTSSGRGPSSSLSSSSFVAGAGSINIASLAATFESSMSKSKRLNIPDYIVDIVFSSSSTSSSSSSQSQRIRKNAGENTGVDDVVGVITEEKEEGGGGGEDEYEEEHHHFETHNSSSTKGECVGYQSSIGNSKNNGIVCDVASNDEESSDDVIDVINEKYHIISTSAATAAGAGAGAKSHTAVDIYLTPPSDSHGEISKKSDNSSRESVDTDTRNTLQPAEAGPEATESDYQDVAEIMSPSTTSIEDRDLCHYHDDEKSVTIAGTRNRATVVSEGIEVGPSRRNKDSHLHGAIDEEESELDDWLDEAVMEDPEPAATKDADANERIVHQQRHRLGLPVAGAGGRTMKYRPGRGFTTSMPGDTNTIGDASKAAVRGGMYSSSSRRLRSPISLNTMSSITSIGSVSTATATSHSELAAEDEGGISSSDSYRGHGGYSDGGRDILYGVDSDDGSRGHAADYEAPADRTEQYLYQHQHERQLSNPHSTAGGKDATTRRNYSIQSHDQQFGLQQVQPQHHVAASARGGYSTTRGRPIPTPEGNDLDDWLDSVIE